MTTRGGRGTSMTIEGSGGSGNPIRISNETPARAGAVNAVARPTAATPNRTFVFICARIDEALGEDFRTSPLKEDELLLAFSMAGSRC